MKIVLNVRNQGHVPSFKTQKRAAIHSHTGLPFVVSKKEIKQWMRRCAEGFESQLFCATQTIGDVTLTAPCPRSLIASSLPLDDSRQWIGSLRVDDVDVEPGEEGATLIIEEL